MMFSLSWHDMIPSEDEDLGVAEGDNNDVREVGDQHQPSKNICGYMQLNNIFQDLVDSGSSNRPSTFFST